MHQPLQRLRPTFGLATLLFCLGPNGCASDEAMEQRFKALQEEVDRVQGRADRLEERLTALEVERQKQPLSMDEEGEVRGTGRPALKVVKVSRGEEAQAKQPEKQPSEDEGPRPMIRAIGSGEGRIENLDKEPARPNPTRQKPEGGS